MLEVCIVPAAREAALLSEPHQLAIAHPLRRGWPASLGPTPASHHRFGAWSAMPGLKPGDAGALALQELMFPKVRLFPIGRNCFNKPDSVLSNGYCMSRL